MSRRKSISSMSFFGLIHVTVTTQLIYQQKLCNDIYLPPTQSILYSLTKVLNTRRRLLRPSMKDGIGIGGQRVVTRFIRFFQQCSSVISSFISTRSCMLEFLCTIMNTYYGECENSSVPCHGCYNI
jgi:hypothetical protein